MSNPLSFEDVRSRIHSWNSLLAAGLSARAITQAVKSKAIVRIGRARYVYTQDWQEWWPESRLLARVIATAPFQGSNSYFCLESAAVLHGLPLYQFTGRRSQIFMAQARSVTSSEFVERKLATLRPGEFGQIHGVACTSVERTLFDLARLSPPERAFACANAAMRLRFPRERTTPLTASAQQWRGALIDRLSCATGERGVRRARSLFLVLDGSAESVLEAVAHHRFRALGYKILTQVRVSAESRGNYFLDIELDGLGVFCEVDGRIKYSGDPNTGDADAATAENIADVVFKEKEREDWVRGITGKRVIRLTAKDLLSLDTLKARLAAFHVPAPAL